MTTVDAPRTVRIPFDALTLATWAANESADRTPEHEHLVADVTYGVVRDVAFPEVWFYKSMHLEVTDMELATAT